MPRRCPSDITSSQPPINLSALTVLPHKCAEYLFFHQISYPPTDTQTRGNPELDGNVQQIPSALPSMKDRHRRSLCNPHIQKSKLILWVKIVLVNVIYCYPKGQQVQAQKAILSQNQPNNTPTSEFVAFCCMRGALSSTESITRIF